MELLHVDLIAPGSAEDLEGENSIVGFNEPRRIHEDRIRLERLFNVAFPVE
jgi:hypothetical protein